MLGIFVGNVFLDLSPGTKAQLERSSPFFAKDSLADEYSLPFTFPYSPRNAQALGLQNHFYTRRLKKRVPARLFDNNNFSYSGELVIESADLNVNDVTKSSISGYFLTGASSFFSLIKNKKLQELTLGGVRSFAWTNNDPLSSNKGFWQHIHETLPGTMPYSFAPIRNEKWSGNSDEGSEDWMNGLNNLGQIDYNGNFNSLAPQISLKYVLEQVFKEHGWVFDYSQMQDLHWESLFMPSFYAVTWQKIIQTAVAPYFDYAPLPTINLNLQNHVPPDYPIANFIIDLRNRYNWGFDFDSSNRTCKMFALKNLANGKRKDWSAYMNPRQRSDFSEDLKVFSFRTTVDGADALSSQPDFAKIQKGEPVLNFSELPAPVEANFNVVVYCYFENQFFQCRYNEVDLNYEWALYADNIYDYEPDGHNEEISSAISTMPVYRTLYRTNGLTDYYGLFPLCEQEGNWEGKAGEFIRWGMRLLFHRGLVWEANSTGLQGQIQYPYLTSVPFTITQTEPDFRWSNVLKHDFEGKALGIVDYWFRDTLKYLEQSEVMSGILNLPRQELMNFSWSDVILLRNIPYIVQKIREVIPYKNTVEAELRRIG